MVHAMQERKFRIKIDPTELVPERRERRYYGLSAILIALMLLIGLLVLFAELLPSQIPLYFSLPWGEARLASRFQLLRIPLMGLLFMIINLLVARTARGEAVLSIVLAVATLVINVMLLVSLLGIIQSVL